MSDEFATAAERLAAPIRAGDVDELRSDVSPGAFEITGFGLDHKATVSLSAEISEVLTSADLNLSREVASTLTLIARDPDRALLQNPMLTDQALGGANKNVHVLHDEMRFSLAQVKKQGPNLTLAFEDWVIATLRQDLENRTVARGTMTLPQFMRSVTIGQGRRFKFVCPDLNRQTGTAARPSVGQGDRARIPGFAPGFGLTIKTEMATKQQLENVARVIHTGLVMQVPKKVLISSIMTIIGETVARNLKGGDADSVGLFQQRKSQGWPATRVPETDAAEYFRRAVAENIKHPNEKLWELCANVQRPREDLRQSTYDPWRGQAYLLVNAYINQGASSPSLILPSDFAAQPADHTAAPTDGKARKIDPKEKFAYSQGPPYGPDGESAWECLQRYAVDLGYHCFADPRTLTVYFIADSDLINSRPRLSLSENDDDVDTIDFDCDAGKPLQTAIVRCRAGLWVAPHGSVVVVTKAGPGDGRWIVNDYRRGLFGTTAEIDLVRPTPGVGGKSTQQHSTKSASAATTGAAGTKVAAIGAPTATGKQLAALVLANTKIDVRSYNSKNYDDVRFDRVHDEVLRGLIAIAGAGFTILITALKSNHSKYTASGNISEHFNGKAADIGAVGGFRTSSAANSTRALMQWIKDNQQVLGWQQLFGPIAALNFVSPEQSYGSVFPGHDNHIHIGY